MKKIIQGIFTVFILLISINSVNAMTLKPSGATSGKRGDEVTLYVTLERSSSEKTVSAVDGTLSYNANVLELVNSSNLMTGWTQLAGITNGSAFSYGNLSFDNLITNTSQNIIKMVFKVKDSAAYGNSTVTISSPSATDEKGDYVSVSGGSHNIKVLSDVNTLSNITISNWAINFNENTTEYNLTIDSSSANINATKKDSNSSVSGDTGTKSLNYGLNTFKITVTSESGKSKVYTLNITRPDNRSKVNTLSSLKISKGSIKFNKNTTIYNVTVDNNVSSIKVEASLTDNKSSFVQGYGPREVKLNVGSNKIEIKVKAENEEVKTYTINVTRKEANKPVNNETPKQEEVKKSNNNYLSDLKLSDGNLVFDKNTVEYKVTVLYKVDKIEIKAKTEDEKAKYEISGNEKIEVGENTILIKVTAEDGSTREYKIVVVRKEENAKLSNNSKLKSLTITEYNLKFKSNIYEYSLKIKNEDKLKITYTKEDSKSSVTITGNENLKNGSTIKVSVVAEDGTMTTYKINIEKDTTKNNLILSIVAILSVLTIILAVVLVISKKKQKAH